MPALLFSAGSNAIVQPVCDSLLDDPKPHRLVFQWMAPLPAPTSTFTYMHGEDIVFSNDFVTCNDVHDYNPKPVSVLLNSELATPHLLAFASSTRRKGKNKQSRAQRKRKARAVSSATASVHTCPSFVPGSRAGLVWDDAALNTQGTRSIITCEVPS